jgi:TetR/AcrR family transcriptional regulator, cmeABC operon repressor
MAKKPVTQTKKEKLIEAAIKLFVKKGYERTSLKDLAKAVGIQAPGVYYYFKSKEEILSEIVDSSWEKYRELVMDKVRQVEDPEEQVKMLIRLMIAFQLDMGETSLLFDDPIPAVKALPNYREHVQEGKLFRQELVRQFAETKGLDKRININVLTFALFQLVTGVRKRLELWKGHSVEELTDHIINLFFYGCYGFGPANKK